MNFLKRQFPLILAFVTGVIFIVQYFIPHQWSQDALTWGSQWIMIITGAALFLGVGSLLHTHYFKLRHRAQGWGYSLVMYFGFVISMLAGFLPAILRWIYNTPAKGEPPDFLGIKGIKLVAGTETDGPLYWLFNTMMNPMSATMFSIIGFFIASAAFRAFRARRIEATLLLIAAVIIMLGQTPLGGLIWSGLPDVMTWILTVPNTAAKRAILFGLTLGSIAFSLRIILGIERAYLGGND